jgi:hypothetical protein
MGMLHPNADARAANMTRDFLKYAEAAEAGVSYEDAKSLLSVSTNQAETRKSFFEEIALLFVPYRSNRIVLTPLGKQFATLLDGEDLLSLSTATARQATAILVWAMAKCQIARPQSRGVPRPTEAEWCSCDVRPYAATWSALSDLDGELSLDEFMGVLRKVHRTEHYLPALAQIRAARASGKPLATDAEMNGRSEMNYRIYWRSHMTVAEQVLALGKDKVFRPVSANWDIVHAALKFLAGCGGKALDAISARPWADAEDYFINVAGGPCPPFLASGTPKITKFEGQQIADLRGYAIKENGARFSIAGGSELCHLPIKMPCFHDSVSGRLLRVDSKQDAVGGGVELELGLGRPITSLDLLKKALGKSNA